jgi:hypothetical protein
MIELRPARWISTPPGGSLKFVVFSISGEYDDKSWTISAPCDSAVMAAGMTQIC